MALKEQVSNVYGVGLRNVGSYQVSGTPWITGSAIADNKVQLHIFPYVSKSFTLINTGSNAIAVHFASGSVAITEGTAVAFTASHGYYANNHYITVAGAGSVTFDVKCKEVYISADNNGASGYQIFAELTNIPAGRMYELTGEGITS
tara:strand:- start:465 stop:905 length:441 start_codon:yes stop_codon:yes gene_type:complete